MRLTASSMRRMLTRPARTSASSISMNCGALLGCMNMSMPALTPVRTLNGVRPVLVGFDGSGIWWMPSQSEMTKPSKSSCPLSRPVMRSRLACILIGLPTPSSTKSTLENEGITLVTSSRRIACAYGDTSMRRKSRRFVTVMPWSIV